MARHEDALAKAVLETGDRIGALPPRRLCLVSKTSLLAPQPDRVQLALKQILDHTRRCCSLQYDASEHFDRLLCISRTTAYPTGPSDQLGNQSRTAARTVQATTQRGIRTVLHPTLSRRFRTNDRQLRYRRLPIDCFTDTLFSNTTSRRNNKCAHIFATPDGWCRAFPMAKKSQAHEGLSLLLQREGAPNTMIMDGAKEQVMGMFRRKCREAGIRVKQNQTLHPMVQCRRGGNSRAERGVGRQMVRSRAPKRLWDDRLEREAYVRSLTAHEIYRLDGQVPETLVSGETADISPFAAFKWYQWVLFETSP
jgi:hypothetical protein